MFTLGRRAKEMIEQMGNKWQDLIRKLYQKCQQDGGIHQMNMYTWISSL